ncbi:hypothetical protein TIFTF001_005955 [Ficus carica]|uniref:Uncharacterized protein n=1 Tax=Ficus carica TaxID=3494 RepID=A0AA87ZQ08_FICCA|nr:hypothetical protein TIFTF001_005955 [Ficus carica]
MCIGSGVVGLRDSLASNWFFAVGGGVEERRYIDVLLSSGQATIAGDGGCC